MSMHISLPSTALNALQGMATLNDSILPKADQSSDSITSKKAMRLMRDPGSVLGATFCIVQRGWHRDSVSGNALSYVLQSICRLVLSMDAERNNDSDLYIPAQSPNGGRDGTL
jgi:hypothetical protein